MRSAFETRSAQRQRIEQIIERLIEIIDDLDGDTDFESDFDYAVDDEPCDDLLEEAIIRDGMNKLFSTKNSLR